MFVETLDGQFRNAFVTWRAEREEWQSLLKAVRSNASADELQKLAGPAGALDEDEIRQLVQVRQRGLRDVETAKTYPTAAKRLAQMDKEVAKLREAAEKASANEYAGAMAELQKAVDARERFWRVEYIGPEQARRYVEEVAKPMNVI